MACIVFIVGPTAIGKTHLSVKLAKTIHGEIISCDSMQVYKGMTILSQAPRAKDRKGVKHYLIGRIDPREEYSVASFRKNAAEIINSIIKHGNVPIVVGGSGLYVKALIDGLFPSPKADSKFRKRMENFILNYGTEMLHRKLSEIDPDAAKKIHPNDARRIIRALEVYHSTGRTMTDLKQETEGLKDCYSIKIFGLTKPRDEVYSGIDSRIDRMFKGKIVDEVRRLGKLNLSKTAKAVLGFKEISGYLDGKYDIETTKSLMKRNTRRFAKQQLTWFRADRRIKWFDMTKTSEEEVVRRMAEEVS